MSLMVIDLSREAVASESLPDDLWPVVLRHLTLADTTTWLALLGVCRHMTVLAAPFLRGWLAQLAATHRRQPLLDLRDRLPTSLVEPSHWRVLVDWYSKESGKAHRTNCALDDFFAAVANEEEGTSLRLALNTLEFIRVCCVRLWAGRNGSFRQESLVQKYETACLMRGEQCVGDLLHFDAAADAVVPLLEVPRLSVVDEAALAQRWARHERRADRNTTELDHALLSGVRGAKERDARRFARLVGTKKGARRRLLTQPLPHHEARLVVHRGSHIHMHHMQGFRDSLYVYEGDAACAASAVRLSLQRPALHRALMQRVAR